MNNQKKFATPNLALAAYLVAGQHLRLLDVQLADDRRRAVFVFADDDAQGSRFEAGFHTGNAAVPAAAFHHQLRVLRRLIEERAFAAKNGAGRGSTRGIKR